MVQKGLCGLTLESVTAIFLVFAASGPTHTSNNPKGFR